MEFTDKEIEALKAKHGDVYAVRVGGKSCLLRRPKRAELSYAMQASKTNPLKFNEHILTACWLAGDDEIKSDDTLFLGVSGVLDQLVQVSEAALEKL